MSHSSKRVRGAGSGSARRYAAFPGLPHKRQKRDRIFVVLFSVVLGMGIVVGMILMVLIGHVGSNATASGGGPDVPPGYGSLNHQKGPCGNAAQSPCASPNPDWFAIGAETPAGATAAIAASKDFLGISAKYGCSLLDTPSLVYSYGAHTGSDYYDDDHWVVSVRDNTGMRCGLADFVYDLAHKRMRFSSFGVLTSQDPHSRQVFPYVSSTVAVSQLQRQRKLAPFSRTVPKLIFFPIDPNFPYRNSPVHKWAGGGNSAMNPMWYIVGADGRDYFLGEDLSIYTQADLPIAKGQP